MREDDAMYYFNRTRPVTATQPMTLEAVGTNEDEETDTEGKTKERRQTSSCVLARLLSHHQICTDHSLFVSFAVAGTSVACRESVHCPGRLDRTHFEAGPMMERVDIVSSDTSH